MTEENSPEFIIVGPSKAATTWVYECLKEHPEVYMPETDSVNFFNMKYHKGLDWYQKFFQGAEENQIIGEETIFYIRNVHTPERIKEDLGEDTKLIFLLRNPVDRAFSHYWHEKKDGEIEFEFEDILENHDLFENWVMAGMYHTHIQRYLKHFDRENLKLMVFDDLVEDDEEFISEIFEFVGANPEYKPSYLDDKVNEAGVQWLKPYEVSKNFLRENLPENQVDNLRPLHNFFKKIATSKNEYEKGMDEEVRKELEKIFKKEVEALSEFLGRDLSDWFEYEELES